MRLAGYLREKLFAITLHVGILLFTGIFLHTQGITSYGTGFLLGLYTIGAAASMALEFFRRRAYYNHVLQTLDQLDQKFLLPEMIEPAPFPEGEILCQVVCEMGKSMNDEVGKYTRISAEYREYVEMWIHVVKTPVASTRLLIENNPSPVTKSIGEELEKVDYYLEQALYYARSSGVEKDYLIRRTPLRGLCNAVIRRNAKAFIRAGAGVKTQALDCDVFTDSKWMEFILHQLVVNALKYRREEHPMVAFSARQERNCVLLLVEDNGIGISPQDLPRVFEKGYTGRTGRLYAKSTGMGLYLCKKLCEKMGLSIQIKSQAGRGTSVCIVFPKGIFPRLEEGALTKP